MKKKAFKGIPFSENSTYINVLCITLYVESNTTFVNISARSLMVYLPYSKRVVFLPFKSITFRKNSFIE